ncbi:two-component system chemotaxis response regulator CheB [Azospirillum brasilense]|uniref:protein-glutamate methylesterase n=1 Tax=Azospirillum brasilense TaxID=192 RepID=A0A560AHD1_AZOBR|nr:chemotaxis protein CheB [Azospirillum brasilense]TWA59771.1 two-component system chemotaxis response regulator CheB [Azospirillum brasilense]
MDKKDILAIGASAGGITALRRLFAAMPRDVTATVFVVQHIGATRSVLPVLLSRAGWLPAFHPEDGEPVREGWIHVAPPDHHLLVKDGCALVRRGARENRCRPAIDPLFRSVAVAYGVRVVGLILTGTLDDGTAGLRAVKRCGGLALVQDPDDAEWPDMPRNAMRHVSVDACAPLSDLPALLGRLLNEPSGPPVPVPDDIATEARVPETEFDAVPELTAAVGKPSTLSCPDCGGNLVEIEDGPLLRFRCKVGHAYGPAALAESHRESIEQAIWVALRTHQDRAIMFRRLAERAREHGHAAVEAHWTNSAREAERTVAMLKEVLSKQGQELAGSLAEEGED